MLQSSPCGKPGNCLATNLQENHLPTFQSRMFFILTIGAKHVKEDLGCNSMHFKWEITWRKVCPQAKPRDLWAWDCSPARIILKTFQPWTFVNEQISPLAFYFTWNFSGTRKDIVKLLPQLGPSPGIILHKYFIFNKLINIFVFRVVQSLQLVLLD